MYFLLGASDVAVQFQAEQRAVLLAKNSHIKWQEQDCKIHIISVSVCVIVVTSAQWLSASLSAWSLL